MDEVTSPIFRWDGSGRGYESVLPFVGIVHRDSGKKCLVNSVVPKNFVACLVYSLPIQVVSLAVVLSVYGIARTVSLGTGVTLLWWLVALMIGTITSLITLTTLLGFRYSGRTGS
ncbi:MAG: hypothetical protein R3C28_05265 [Pirellulaceae bacterium]